MTVIVLQHQKPLGAFQASNTRRLTRTDEARAEGLIKQSTVAESGYYDVLLVPGRLSATCYSDAGVSPAIVARWYRDARDQFIGVK